LLQGKPPHAKLLLFADQFEELFTTRVDARYRAPFIKLIAVIGQKPSRLRLLLTLRADYYEHCTRNEQLAALLRDASFPLSAPNTHALTEMIERPARIAGLKLGDGLAGAILDDVGAEPGALALVEFALAEIYERSGGERMTAEAYRALGRQDAVNGNTGGIGGIIDRQAERAVQDEQGRVDESTLSKIFPLLADVDEKGGAVRKRAKLDDFVGPESSRSPYGASRNTGKPMPHPIPGFRCIVSSLPRNFPYGKFLAFAYPASGLTTLL